MPFSPIPAAVSDLREGKIIKAERNCPFELIYTQAKSSESLLSGRLSWNLDISWNLFLVAWNFKFQ